jgi:putative ABC transport system ATP-binding protein
MRPTVIVEKKHDVRQGEDGRQAAAGADRFIELEGLSKQYREGDKIRLVLDDASAAFRRGEFAAVVGKSGTGKSTLLNIISGIDRADAGRITLDGQVLTGLDDRRRTLFRRRNIGFVFQFFNLIPTLTVWENVILPLELAGGLNGQGPERAERLLESVGLIDRRETFPDRLSGGEQQRVAIARALVHDPLLVLADEPTGNLDEATGEKVLSLLDDLTRQAGKNLIMVTHDLGAAAIADRVLCLQGGKFEKCE